MLNRCDFIGNLGRDPEVRTFQDGGKVCNLRLACTEKWKDRNSGERRERTEWVSVAVFGPLAEVAERYLRKGSCVFVSGKLQTRKWADQSGADRYSTEVVVQGFEAKLVMLGGPAGGNRDSGDSYGGGDYGSGESYGGAPSRDIDDSIPF